MSRTLLPGHQRAAGGGLRGRVVGGGVVSEVTSCPELRSNRERMFLFVTGADPAFFSK